MTVSTTLNKITYAGNGASTVFTFTFPGVAASDIQVFFTDALGNVSLLASSAYTLTLNPATGTNPTGAGGTVTYNPLGVPIPVGTSLTIYRNLPLTQSTSLANQGTLYQPVEEQALDYVTMLIQQVQELQGRALAVAITDPAPANLPAVAARSNLFLAFDASGNPIASQPSGSNTPISSAMVPVVTAASLAAGRTAFGLGTAATEGIGPGLQDNGSGLLQAITLVVADSTPQTANAAFHTTRRVLTANVTYTLARANTLILELGFWIQTGSFSATLTPNANDAIFGGVLGQSIVIPPGQSIFVQLVNNGANGSWTIDFGNPIGMESPLNLTIAASVASNNLTIAIRDRGNNDPTASSPILLAQPDSNITLGDPIIRAISTALSILVPNGASLGTVNAQTNRIWLAVFDNAGTPVLGVYNSLSGTNIVSWDETNPATGTAITGGSTLAQTWYTQSAVTSKSFRILGYIESTQPVAGTWSVAPSRIRLFGPGVKRPGDTVQEISSLTNTTTAVSGTNVQVVPTATIVPQFAGDVIKVETDFNYAISGAGSIQARLGRTSSANLFGSFIDYNFSSGVNRLSSHIAGYDLPNTVASTAYNAYATSVTSSGTWNSQGNTMISAKEISI